MNSLLLQLVLLGNSTDTLLAHAQDKEWLGCIEGVVAPVTVVNNIYTLSARATGTWTIPNTYCNSMSIGMVHSHSPAERCWYFFPRTSVPTSDYVSFKKTGYDIDAILCGNMLIWIKSEEPQRELLLK